MTDFNNLSFFVATAVAALFAFGYVRQRMEMRWTAHQKDLSDFRRDTWEQTDKIMDRLDRLERRMDSDCCEKK